jgi:hypothetical protein
MGGVAGEVHYIAIRPGADAKSSGRLSISRGINGFDCFPFEFKVSVSLIKPSLECLHNSGLQRASGVRAVHDTGWDVGMGRDMAGSWMLMRPAGTARTTNRAPVPCPHGPGWAIPHGPHGFRPKPEKENNPLQKSIKTKR